MAHPSPAGVKPPQAPGNHSYKYDENRAYKGGFNNTDRTTTRTEIDANTRTRDTHIDNNRTRVEALKERNRHAEKSDDRQSSLQETIAKKLAPAVLALVIAIPSTIFGVNALGTFTEPKSTAEVEANQPRLIEVVMAQNPRTGEWEVVNQDMVTQELNSYGMNIDSAGLDTLLQSVSDSNGDQTIQAKLGIPNGVDFVYKYLGEEASPK